MLPAGCLTAGGHAGRDEQQGHGAAPQAAVHLGRALDEAREEPVVGQAAGAVCEGGARPHLEAAVRVTKQRENARPMQHFRLAHYTAITRGPVAPRQAGCAGPPRDRRRPSARPAHRRRCAAAADTSMPSYSTRSSSDESDEEVVASSDCGLLALISSATACPFFTSSRSSSVAAAARSTRAQARAVECQQQRAAQGHRHGGSRAGCWAAAVCPAGCRQQPKTLGTGAKPTRVVY